MIFADGFFHSVSADDFLTEVGTIPDLSVYGGDYPKWISVALPEDYTKQSAVRQQARQNNLTIRMLDDYYKPFETIDVDMKRDAFPLEDIQLSDKQANVLTEFLTEHGGIAEDYAFIRFGTRYELALLAIKTGGEISGVLTMPSS